MRATGRPRRTEHDVVGWRFKSFGSTYRCTRYDPSCGFWMTLLEVAPEEDSSNPRYHVGWQACVSERAPGRTFHRIWMDPTPEPHAAGCRCYVCEPHEE
jgi:hypothetical protein